MIKSIFFFLVIFCLSFANCSDEAPSGCSDFEQNIKTASEKLDIRVYGLPKQSNPIFLVEVKSINSIKRLSKSHFINNELSYTLDFAERGETYNMTLSMCDGSTDGTYSLFFSYKGRTGTFENKGIGTTNQFTVPL